MIFSINGDILLSKFCRLMIIFYWVDYANMLILLIMLITGNFLLNQLCFFMLVIYYLGYDDYVYHVNFTNYFHK